MRKTVTGVWYVSVRENLFLLFLIIPLFSMMFEMRILFGITIDFPSTVWIVVALSQICFTVPVKVFTVMMSPILNGLDPIIENELKKSSRSFCAANATAIPPTPSEARRGVNWTPITSKTIKIVKIQISTCKTVFVISVRFFCVFSSWWLNILLIIISRK